MRKLLLALCFLSSACAGACPKCLRGHDTIVHHEGYWYTDTDYVKIGDVTVPISHREWRPAWDETRFVCDQYEVEERAIK